MYASFNGRNVTVYRNNTLPYNHFTVSNDVVDVHISENSAHPEKSLVSITMRNGKTVVYRANGLLWTKT